MRNLTLILVGFVTFLTSCQTASQIGNSDSGSAIQVQNTKIETVGAETAPTTEQLPVDDIDSKVGVVNITEVDGVCLTIRNFDLKEGEEIFVIFPNRPQSVQTAKVQKKLSSTCSRSIGIGSDDSFYLLELSKPLDDLGYIAFGVISSNKIVVNNGTASVDLDGDKKAEYFRKCTATEGVLLTVWTGKPLIGRRIWIRFYYLNYDTEPTCTGKDDKNENIDE